MIMDDIVTLNSIQIDTGDKIFSHSMIDTIRRGNYEQAEAELIREYLQPEYAAVDLGAGIGYTTSVISEHTLGQTPVIGVEANKNLIPTMNKLKELNETEFEILNTCYHPTEDHVDFYIAEDFWSSSIEGEKENNQKIEVPASSLSDIISEFELTPPIQLVADIEGSEFQLISSEQTTLEENIRLLIIEFHSTTEHNISDYESLLEDIGFNKIDSRGVVHVYLNEGI
jgi:FkbM family methyltransferase